MSALSQCTQGLIDHTLKVFTIEPSNYNLILGRRGTGKTALSLLQVQILALHFRHLKVASNIKILNSPKIKIEFIKDLETLREWTEAYKTKTKVFILDEVGRVAKRRRFMSSINVKMIEDLQILRKFKLNLVYIAPSESVIDKQLLESDYLDGFYDKYSTGHLQYTDIYHNHRLDIRIVDGIPFTDIKYDTHDTATFTEFPAMDEVKVFFEEDKLNKLYQWSKGAKAHDLGISRKTIQEWIRKLTKRELERKAKEVKRFPVSLPIV